LAVLGAVIARGSKVRVAPVARKDLEQHIVASGRVWVPTRIQVSARAPGLVLAVGAVEGQRVSAGDFLVQIDDAEARAAVAQAKAAVAQASARVEQLRRVGAIVATETLRQTQSTLDQAETDLERTQKLVASGAVPSAELESIRRAVDVARAQRAAAQAQQLSSAPMGADSRVALTSLMQAEAALTGANVRLDQMRITAPQDGLVLTRSVEAGDVVQPGHTLLVIAADSHTELVFQPDERNLAVIALGQKARASADAYPAQPFDAEVSYIAPSIDPQRGSVEVRLLVRNDPAFLKPDMTVSIDLTVAARQHVLTVPSDTVHGAATPSPWVFTVDGDHVARADVKLGIHGEGTTEIVSGLEENGLVVIPDGRALKAGQHVRTERD
ncbi:MAG: efflux RND transporter periplasmic adaptor subunit, partial [Polyangiaceae bacterium]